jgi:hypothetical protein
MREVGLSALRMPLTAVGVSCQQNDNIAQVATIQKGQKRIGSCTFIRLLSG